MKRILSVLAIVGAVAAIAAVSEQATKPKIDLAQVPKWSSEDLDFFLHGSMSTEVVPEPVLRAFIKIYPELFPQQNLAYLGLIPDPEFGWPIGFSKKKVSHLGDLPSLGLNCASCHVAEVRTNGAPPVRVLGATSHFDAEAFFGAVAVATFKTSDPANMKKFLKAYFPNPALDSAWEAQKPSITEKMAADPFGANSVKPGELYVINATDLELGKEAADLPKLAQSFVKLFHNMRAALHIPDQPPEKAPPSSGPGRNDAFGLLSAGLFNAPQPFAPVKYGLVWNVGERHWVHWDGNTRSPIGRNLLASLGLGAPLRGKHGELDFALVKRQTDITEMIKPPRYPFAIDQSLAKHGAAHFNAQCASCHGGDESDKRLYSAAEVGTDPMRAEVFTSDQAGRFNKFLSELESQGYQPAKEEGLRSTGKYWAPTLSGVWARSPYLHNGSVRTMQELLKPAAERAKIFKRGSQDFDTSQMGYTDGGPYVFDTSMRGNSSSGHEYGTKLSAEEKRELMEYLKTL